MSEDSKTERNGPTRARVVLSDLVPDGRSMVVIERPDETVLAVRPGEMSSGLVDEWNRHLAHAEHLGLWNMTSPMERPRDHPPA